MFAQLVFSKFILTLCLRKIWMKKFTLALCAFFLLLKFSWAQLVINEVSQGPSGNKEYIELIVVGTPDCTNETVDLRGWIIDDNNGTFKTGAGNGIANGCIRLKNIAFWQAIKIGTLIVVYNEADKNTLIPADDLSKSDGNCVLIIPGDNNTLLERHTSEPDLSSSTYPTSGFVNTSGWTVNSMQGSDDSFQTRSPIQLNTPHHAVSWGSNSQNNIIYFSGSATGLVFSMENINSNDINSQSNWVSEAANASNQTPGTPNNAANATWINSLSNNCNTFTGGLVSVFISTIPAGPFCVGESIQLIANTNPSPTSTMSYTWKENGVATGTNISSITITVTSNPTTYNITVSDVCGAPVTNNLVITGNTVADASFGPSSKTFCETEGIINIVPVNAGGNFSISPATIAFDATNKTFNPSLAEKNVFYTVTYAIPGVCGESKTNVYSVNANPTAQITLSKIAPYCFGESVILSSSASTGNVWSNGETGTSITVKESGKYTLTVTGCANIPTTAEVDIEFLKVNADFTPSITEGNIPLDVLFKNTSTGATIYEWNFGDKSELSTITEPSHIYANEGSYTVTLLAKNNAGCSDSTSYNFIKVSSTIFISIPNVFSPNNDKVNDLFEIKSVGVKSFECYIYNRWGKQVANFKDITTNWDGGDYADGVYFYLINVTFIDNTSKEYNGNVTLLR